MIFCQSIAPGRPVLLAEADRLGPDVHAMRRRNVGYALAPDA
jgi:hypothetical protein